MYSNSPKRFVHEGCWEVLDEGVGGSLTTHLQEVCYQAARVNKVQPLKDTREVQLPGGRVSIPSKSS